jgi:hypothetical protein
MPLTSMTGFADLAAAAGEAAWVWEARSVNGRGLDLRLRLPEGFEALEARLRAAATQALARGSVTIGVRMAQGARAFGAAAERRRVGGPPSRPPWPPRSGVPGGPRPRADDGGRTCSDCAACWSRRTRASVGGRGRAGGARRGGAGAGRGARAGAARRRGAGSRGSWRGRFERIAVLGGGARRGRRRAGLAAGRKRCACGSDALLAADAPGRGSAARAGAGASSPSRRT